MFAKIFIAVCAIASINCGAISYTSGGLHLDDDHGIGDYGHGISLVSHAVAAPIAYAKPVAIAKEVVDYSAPAHYEFKYGVEDAHTGDKKQQSEVRVGDSVKGEYSLAEPDGTVRVVKYTADPHNGFNAVVSRIGKAVHPQVVHKVLQPVVAKTLVAAPVYTKALVSAPLVTKTLVSHDLGLDLGGYH
ncbi:adult-specific cuticular protein ACP-20-like [Diabrotica virgifera virgifera]|uniref:Adult-specific cuticular protein ACP-20-like n=1 Tax=Diabrotica virgifera virgifera TaxID=50390 RepID=A0ABM5IW83_DIAVI|nr:adult-specific cuticular protein ACP-20-like [Diabrotica virgifera virgifera]